MDLGVMVTTFVVVFPAELPDKTMIASLVLGTRFRPWPVFLGAAVAFLFQVVIAVAVGQAIALLPHRVVDIIVAALFAIGAAILLFGKEQAEVEKGTGEGAGGPTSTVPIKVAATSFTIVFLAEFGDLTQIATANLAARYNEPFSVAVGAVVALWAVAAIAVLGGRALVRFIPLQLVRRIAGVILAVLAVVSLVEALR